VGKPRLFQGEDESLLHGDAAMPANCTEPGTDAVIVAPGEVLLAKLAALIADGVLGRPSRTPGRLVKHDAHLVGGRSPLESCQT